MAFEGGDLFFPLWLGTFRPITLGNPITNTIVSSAWANFSDTTTQSIASTTVAYPITLNYIDPHNQGVSLVSNSKITVQFTGLYQVQFSAQLASGDTSLHNANIWIRKNDVDLPDSTGQITVPNSHGGIHGQIISSWTYLLELQAGDYIQFYWQAESTGIYLETLPAGTTPTTPVSPSFAVTVAQVK